MALVRRGRDVPDPPATISRVTVPVRLRSPESDLVILHEMLNWASTVRVKGVRLLDGNPLAGIRRPREQNPLRPIASFERSDTETLLTCYQQADTQTLLAVMGRGARSPRGTHRASNERVIKQALKQAPPVASARVSRRKSIGTAGFEPATL